MDATRFDFLTKGVGTGSTRRTFTTLLVGLGLGSLDAKESAAKKSSHRSQPTCPACTESVKGKCKKKNGKKSCQKDTCQPASGTPCTLATGESSSCQNGPCVTNTVCTGGLTNCIGVCTDLQSDEAN